MHQTCIRNRALRIFLARLIFCHKLKHDFATFHLCSTATCTVVRIIWSRCSRRGHDHEFLSDPCAACCKQGGIEILLEPIEETTTPGFNSFKLIIVHILINFISKIMKGSPYAVGEIDKRYSFVKRTSLIGFSKF